MIINESTTESFQTEPIGHPDTTSNQVFGFWLYLMSDLILFGALFATFAVIGRNYAGGPTGKELFHLPYVLGETMLLLLSSGTCGLAMIAMHKDKSGLTVRWLIVTFMLGLGFIAMETRELSGMVIDGNGPQRSAFLSAFFTLVGTHGAHVASGLIWMAVMIVQISNEGITPGVQSRLLKLSMFWHFLDIVWVCVFTIVYLMGVM